MTNLRSTTMAAALLMLFAGCATERHGAFEPKIAPAPSNPDAFKSYTPAMAHHDGYEMAYEWQTNNAQQVKDATRRELLAKFAESDAAADALLAKIGTAYDGDPVVLTQIAAVTQLVMCPKCPKAPARRRVWIAALERRRANTDDGYVRTFCDQQLRLCR